MLFGNKKVDVPSNQPRQEVYEIDYLKENRVLQDIIKVSYETKDIVAASNKIVQIICRSYNISYCTLFLYKQDRFKVTGTNLPIEMVDRIENFAEIIYKEKCEGKDADAYVLKSEQPMNYDTGWERGIKYMMFSPLVNNGIIGGILIENQSSTLTQDELQFFELVCENIALVLQNLVYFKQIVDQANKDGLTGIYNRNFMNMHLNSVIEEAKLTGRKFSIALFDIDHFKNFNDTYGHLHGDKVLKEVSHYIEQTIRTSDTIYRYGGEEFIIYFANTGIDDAALVLDKLREGVSRLQILTDKNELTQVTISMGVTEFPTYDMSVQGLIEKADQAMYYSKENGRNRVTKYSDLVNQVNQIQAQQQVVQQPQMQQQTVMQPQVQVQNYNQMPQVNNVPQMPMGQQMQMPVFQNNN